MTTQAAMNKQAHASLRTQTAARSPWIEGLPQELFVNIVTYLEPHEIVRATHVCSKWRDICLAQPKLWQTLLLTGSMNRSGDPAAAHERCLAKWDIYRQRLQDSSLLELHIYIKSSHEQLGDSPRAMQKLNWMLFRMTEKERQTLRRLFLWHQHLSSSTSPLDSGWLMLPDLPRLQQMRVDIPEHDLDILVSVGLQPGAGRSPVMRPGFLPQAPLLDTLEFSNLRNTGSNVTRRFPMTWPSCSNILCSSPSSAELASSGSTEYSSGLHQPAKHPSRREIQLFHVQLDSRRATETTLNQLPKVAHLSISSQNPDSSVRAPAWSSLCDVRTLHLSGNVHLLPFGRLISANLHFPLLERLSMLNIVPLAASLMRRVLESQSITPSLRSLHIDALPTNAQDWTAMFRAKTLLQDVRISSSNLKTWELNGFVQWMSNVTTLHIRQCDISQSFLESARKHLTQLTSLDVSYCTNITSSPLLQLIQARQGKITFLGIEGCYDLQKEAVDWCKANVATVKWSGWRDKNEGKKYGFLA